MAWELAGQGKTGISINSTYDAWTPARAYQHYHGGVRILSETASADLAADRRGRRSAAGTRARIQPARAVVEFHQSLARGTVVAARYRLISDGRRLRAAGPRGA